MKCRKCAGKIVAAPPWYQWAMHCENPACEDNAKRRRARKLGNRAQLAGPITGMPDYNRQAFADAAEKIEALGYWVWNPNDLSDLSVSPMSRVSAPNFRQLPKKFWMRRAIRNLFDADLLVMLPGWVRSDGAMAERVVARQFGMPIVYLFDHPGAYRCEWRRQ